MYKYVALIVASIVTVAIAIGVISAVKYYNLGVSYERQIEQVYENNKVVLNTYTTKVQEVAQVPAMYKNDLSNIVKETFEGRYGEGGSKAVFQFIHENNLNLDPAMYRQIQQVMEGGRNDFKVSQQQLVDVVQNYKASLSYLWSGFWLKLVGYPKIDLQKYQIITLNEVSNKFDTGKDSVIDITGNKDTASSEAKQTN